ncbi:hypothetical protein QYE76_027518 [Lolium multiflorum]|uniref:Uncharacterized protein n=1 Tax=Lolium multiflorum TaxID=4521 RepID=A0AAD8VGG0_LOLMU|nr:hypothetical protein QYE76_027518 [Lolium multiflorum]
MPAGTTASRVWPRTGCTFNGSGVGRCITGNCAGKLACAAYDEQPTTIAEYTLGKGGVPDFFDLSARHLGCCVRESEAEEDERAPAARGAAARDRVLALASRFRGAVFLEGLGKTGGGWKLARIFLR